ncbi:MAG: hypothetical protein KBE09_02580 [Candidatus Pacebacteria bacterium]|nr:hypothetical protein [Candidatus Paceibacterota bacterium]
MKRILIAALIICGMFAPATAFGTDRRIAIVIELIQKRPESAPVIKACTMPVIDQAGHCVSTIAVSLEKGVPTIVLEHPGNMYDTRGNAHPVTIIFRDEGMTGILSSATVFHHGPIVRDPLFPGLRQDLYELALDNALDFLLEELTKKR